ncbi:hypothetical protein CAEBREN_13115 [Caenorhabditis brenneri]|uniref:DDE Tnp4 domain-containing protein n=1 Tax=Caenorhabditis brenneri TaxID=135651 RepID=G0NDW4_CAEBE|nr:hypothetical protein CAEBREN_13115 [Caenorhabditis brenneri]
MSGELVDFVESEGAVEKENVSGEGVRTLQRAGRKAKAKLGAGYEEYQREDIIDFIQKIKKHLVLYDASTTNSQRREILQKVFDEIEKNCSKFMKAGVTTLPGSTVPMPAFILSDNGFGLSKHVMTPYRENQLTGTRDLRFNEIISATRVNVENLFGILTSKFQVFGRNLRMDPENSRALIVACSVIHNISNGLLVVSQPYYQTNSALADPYTTAEQMRTALKEYLLSL